MDKVHTLEPEEVKEAVRMWLRLTRRWVPNDAPVTFVYSEDGPQAHVVVKKKENE